MLSSISEINTGTVNKITNTNMTTSAAESAVKQLGIPRARIFKRGD